MATRFFVKIRRSEGRLQKSWYVVRDRNDPSLWGLTTEKPQAMSMDEAERLRAQAAQAIAGRVEVVPAF